MNHNTTVTFTSEGTVIKHFFYLQPAEYDPSFKTFVFLCSNCKSIIPNITAMDPDERNITIEYPSCDTACDRTLMAVYDQYQREAVITRKQQAAMKRGVTNETD